MPQRLLFLDPRAADDALTFASRAARLDDGVVRLQAANGTLIMTAAPLAPQNLLDNTPTVLAMRMFPVDPELECDLCISATALAAAEPGALTLPETAVIAPWAGISPPRTGWEKTGTVAAADVAARAHAGIAEVAQSLPADSGEEIVRTVRAAVWGAPEPGLEDLPRGVAFAALMLGFVVGEEQVSVFARTPWHRLSFSRGHVLVRTTVRSGLTAVRTTGS